MKNVSFYSNGGLDLSPIMLKHKLFQDVAIPKICMKVYQNQSIKLQQNWSINEGARVMTMFFPKINTVTLTLILDPSNSKLFNILSYLTFVESKIKIDK